MFINILKNLSSTISYINKIAGFICAIIVVLMSLNVFLVVVLRYLFGISFIWMQETYVWMHAYIFMLGAGYTYLNDDHVRIDIIYRSSSKFYKALVDSIGIIFLLFPFLYIIWSYSFPFVYKSFQINEVSREAGGLPMMFLLKSAILIFTFLLSKLFILSIIFNDTV